MRVAHAAVCSKAVSSPSRPLIPKRVIAVPPAGRPRGVGGGGGPANAIARPRTARNDGDNSSAATASAVGSDKRRPVALRQRTRRRRARASAQRSPTRFLRCDRARGRDAMSCSLSGMSTVNSVSVRRCAVWLYDASSIAKRVIGSGDDGGDGNASRRGLTLAIPPEARLSVWEPRQQRLKLPPPQARRKERAGGHRFGVPRFLSSIGGQRGGYAHGLDRE